MGKKRIGNFIRGINFLKLTEEQGDELGNKMIDIASQIINDNDNDIQFDEVKDGFAAFAEKVGVPKFPERQSGGYLAAHSAINVLINLVGELEHDEAVSKAFGKVYADTWLALLKAGPSSAQTEIMSTFQTYIFEQYIMNCEHKQFAEMFTQMKITFHYDASIEKSTKSEYMLTLYIKPSAICLNAWKKQLIESRKEFLDLYHHFQKQLSGLSETFATSVGYLLRDMASGFPDENPYGETKGVGHADPKSSKESIERVKNMICDPKIKSNEDIGKLKAGATLEGVIDGMLKANDIPGMIDPLMSLVSEFSKSAGSPFGGEIYATIMRSLFSKMDQDSYVPNVKVYESCLGMVLNVLPHPNVTELMADMIESALEKCLIKFQDMTQPLAKKFVTAMIELLKSGNIILVKITPRILQDDDMLQRLNWKSLIEEVKMMLRIVGKKPTKEMQKNRHDKLGTIIEGYANFCDYFLRALRKSKVVDKVQKELIEAIFDCIELESPAKAEMAYKLQDDLSLSKPDKDLIMFILTRCKADLANKELKWTSDSIRSISNTLQAVITAYNGNGKMVTPEQHKLFAGIFNICMEGDSTVEHFIDYDECHTVYMKIYRDCLSNYYELHRETSTQDCFIDVIPGVLKWARISWEEDCEQVKDTSFRILQNCSIKAVKGMEKYIKDLMDLMFLSEHYQDLSPLITKLYPDNPNDVHASLPDLFDRYPMLKDFYQTLVMNLVMTVSMTHPEAFTDQQIKSLVDWHLDASDDSDSLLLMILRFISEKRPRKLVPHLRSFLKPHKRGHAMMFSLKVYIIGNVGVCDKTLAEESMDFLVSNFEFNDPSVVSVINSMIATLMRASKQYMHKYRKHVERLEKNGTTPAIKDGARHILNILDGKVIEEVFDDVQETKETVNVIDKKVDATIDTVITIGEKVIEHDQDISKLQKEVDTLDERVDDVEDDLGETKVKVEAIDNKTMTNAPKWSRDLTKLMNPTSSADWRLLAQRLQYNNDDIRGWAQQNDPCMAVLSEWYATHKTSEATKAILKILEDMNRMDAVVIVENAMKASEGVVEDEEFEYASPPPIFLSYQWGMQEEVKLLKQHLLMAGFECWMDIGQMGGGDKLFKKIDDGIRAAKVVISCTTEKYAQSPNCNREVNLAVNLGKPIIPLLMEKMDWPPKGSMGPIFSEYLFIRFFQRSGEETKESDQRYWPLSKLNELLMQIHLHIVPDERIVTKEYKNWWNPIVQAVVIDKSKGKGIPTQAKSSAETKTKDASDKSPLVFLSYQWDRQPQVLLLYQRLTSLGYSVWMEIHQMGGGDSLYDKIDRGLRGCKVIVSCVTPKYSLSANCRREVSLADALKKPIIPLLLEEMKWPPGGPMSMVFTELLFINMYKDPNTQKTWSGQKFDELIQKLQEHIPSLTTVESVTAANTKPSNGNAPNKTDPKEPQANAQPDTANQTQKGSQTDSKSGQSKDFTNKLKDTLEASPKPTESKLKANPTKPLSETSQEKTGQSKDSSTGNSKSLEAPYKETESKLKVNPTKSSPEKSKDTSQSKDSSSGKAKSIEAPPKATENTPKANQTNSSPEKSKETSQLKGSSPGKSKSLEKSPKTTENTPKANPTNPSSEMSKETGQSKSCVLL